MCLWGQGGWRKEIIHWNCLPFPPSSWGNGIFSIFSPQPTLKKKWVLVIASWRGGGETMCKIKWVFFPLYLATPPSWSNEFSHCLIMVRWVGNNGEQSLSFSHYLMWVGWGKYFSLFSSPPHPLEEMEKTLLPPHIHFSIVLWGWGEERYFPIVSPTKKNLKHIIKVYPPDPSS